MCAGEQRKAIPRPTINHSPSFDGWIMIPKISYETVHLAHQKGVKES
jgi:hypothetical protein